ncbi:MAG: hypothetical protein ABJ004_03380 [Cyclobacteriaceae bacterium]
MKKHLQFLNVSALILFLIMGAHHSSLAQDLELTGIIDISMGATAGKAVHLTVNANIADLSIYGVGVANNGGGTDGEEFTFPVMTVSAGEQILIARSLADISSYFDGCFAEFDHTFESGIMQQNGDDAVELFGNGNVIETFGDITYSSADGLTWLYEDSWAYKLNGVWIYGGLNCTDGSWDSDNTVVTVTSEQGDCVYPICNLDSDDYWTGAANSSWSDNGNWYDGSAPTGGSNVFIYDFGMNNTAILSSDISVGVLKVAAGISLEVNTTTMAVNDKLILDGSATVASGGALAVLGTATGAGNLTVDRNTAGSDGYSVVGAPVVGASVDGLVSQGATHIFDSDGTTFTPMTSGDMLPGKGYFVAQVGTPAPAVSFTGSLVSGNVTASVAASGFSLLANPYTASISAAAVIASDAANQVTTGSIYIWDDGGSNNGNVRSGTYKVVNNMGTSEFANIGSVQGFFVQANTGGDVTFTPDMQVTTAGANDDGNFYRKASDERQILKLAITGNGLYHETVLGFLNQATLGRDYALDAQYLKGNDLISFYSMIENVKFATQGLPLFKADPIEVTLGMDLAEAGTYTIKVAEFSGFSDDLVVTLEDIVTGQSYDIGSNFEMSFSTGAVANANRFKVVTAPARALSVDNLGNKLQVFGGTSELKINFASNKTEFLSIFSLDGKSVFSSQVTFKNNQAVIQPQIIENQVYILRINEQSIKFIIK